MTRQLKVSKPLAPYALIAFALAIAVSCSNQDATQTESSLDTVITGETSAEVLRSTSDLASSLSREDQQRFTYVRFEYIAAYGEDGMADRLRGKTVRQVIDEFQPTGIEPIETGVTDGVEWKLYAKPESAEDEPDDG